MGRRPVVPTEEKRRESEEEKRSGLGEASRTELTLADIPLEMRFGSYSKTRVLSSHRGVKGKEGTWSRKHGEPKITDEEAYPVIC